MVASEVAVETDGFYFSDNYQFKIHIVCPGTVKIVHKFSKTGFSQNSVIFSLSFCVILLRVNTGRDTYGRRINDGKKYKGQEKEGLR